LGSSSPAEQWGWCGGEMNQALATSAEAPCPLLSCRDVKADVSPVFHLVALQSH